VHLTQRESFQARLGGPKDPPQDGPQRLQPRKNTRKKKSRGGEFGHRKDVTLAGLTERTCQASSHRVRNSGSLSFKRTINRGKFIFRKPVVGARRKKVWDTDKKRKFSKGGSRGNKESGVSFV